MKLETNQYLGSPISSNSSFLNLNLFYCNIPDYLKAETEQKLRLKG